MAERNPVAAALYHAAHDLLAEARSTARRIPTDPAERRGYRKALRWASRYLADWAHGEEVAGQPTTPDGDHPARRAEGAGGGPCQPRVAPPSRLARLRGSDGSPAVTAARDPRWTDETEALVAMHITGDPQDREPARAVLDALFESGVLLPPDAIEHAGSTT